MLTHLYNIKLGFLEIKKNNKTLVSQLTKKNNFSLNT